jgi:hypothetical protein
MKAILTAVLLLTATCFGGESSQITTNATEGIITKITEHRDGNGKPYTSEAVYRGKDAILRILHRRNEHGVATTSRAYMVSGDTVMIESDEDGDGIFEKMILYHPGKGDMDEFTRRVDGSVTPVSTKTLEADKLEHAAAMKKIDQDLHELFDDKPEQK